MTVEKISSVASIAAKTLQGHTTPVSQQREALEKLVATLIKLFKTRYMNDSEREELGADDNSILSTDGRFSLNTDDIRGDLGTFVVNCVETLTEAYPRSLLLDLGHAVLKLISARQMKLVQLFLPCFLTISSQLRGRDFNSVVRTFRERRLTRWSTSRVDLIEQEFFSLLAAFESEEAFKNVLRGFNEATSFDDGWSLTGGRFSVLQEFCGGLSFVFQGTASVESDFSIVKYVKNDFQSSLTDFSLEGILHAKKFRQLLNVNTQ
ncbi:hypothetical protein PsorP6_019314 [Peronosclerospora sorghi]|nr:hypothetical protein PsorP6_019314 [Peronosclerospora sorghi]